MGCDNPNDGPPAHEFDDYRAQKDDKIKKYEQTQESLRKLTNQSMDDLRLSRFKFPKKQLNGQYKSILDESTFENTYDASSVLVKKAQRQSIENPLIRESNLNPSNFSTIGLNLSTQQQQYESLQLLADQQTALTSPQKPTPGGKTPTPGGTKKNKSPRTAKQITNMILRAQKTLDMIIRIQKHWRAHKSRKLVQTLFTAKLSGSMRNPELKDYPIFTEDEFWETLSSTYKYRADQERKEANYKYRCSGAQYSGEFKGGFRDGEGKMTWKVGKITVVYEGQWVDGRASGEGKLAVRSGRRQKVVYEGQWYRDRWQGEGRMEKEDGYRYEGSWLYGEKHGKGIETLTDGSRYSGDFEKGAKSGQGQYTWETGSQYIGLWLDNKIQGVGIQTYPDGRKYEGEFKDNLYDGFGNYIDIEGNIYMGYFKEDKKDGFGDFEWAKSGKKYSGWWKNGKQEGYGVLFKETEEGLIKEKHGCWLNGKFDRWLSQEEIESLTGIQDSVRDTFSALPEKHDERDTFERPGHYEWNSTRVKAKIAEIKKMRRASSGQLSSMFKKQASGDELLIK